MTRRPPFLGLIALLATATACSDILAPRPAPPRVPGINADVALLGPASVLFSQGPRNSDEGAALRSNLDVGPGSAETGQQIADNFMLPSAAQIQRVSWEGSYFQTPLPAGTGTVRFTIRVYTSLTSAPIIEQQVDATHSQVGTSGYGSPIYRMTADLGTPMDLAANTPYWLAIIESDATTPIDFRWWNTQAEGPGEYGVHPSPAEAWYIQNTAVYHDFTFELEGVVDPWVVLLSQGPRHGNEASALRSNLSVGPGSAETEQQVADNFTLAARSQVRQLSWEGFYFQHTLSADSVAFTVRIYDSLTSAPLFDTEITATVQAVATSPYGMPLYRFSADLGSGVALEAGVEYWISILERDPATPKDFTWWQTSLEGPGAYAYRPDPANPWYLQDNPINPDFTFELKGEVVADPGPSPVAHLLPIPASPEGTVITFDGSGSTGTAPLTYAWDLGDGTTKTGVTPRHKYADNGTFTVTLIVTDANGVSSAPASRVADIHNVAPAGTFTIPATAPEDQSLAISIKSIVEPGSADVLEFAFDCGDGAGYGPWQPTKTGHCRPADNGELVVAGKVRDDDGDETEYTGTITVVNDLPSIGFRAPAAAKEGSAFLLQAVNPNDAPGDLPTLRFAFDCGDGAGFSAWSSTASRSCPTSDNELRQVRGAVLDKDGGQREYGDSVQVNNVAPKVVIDSVRATPPGSVDRSVTFHFTDPAIADGSFAAGTQWEGTINCGQGSGTNGFYRPFGLYSAVCSYPVPGTYTITVTIRDKDGGVGSDTKSVTIR